MTRQNLTVLAAALCIAAGIPAAATMRDWHLYPPSCTGGAAAVSFACGDYGRFLIVQSAPPPGCSPLAEGMDDAPEYPPTPIIHQFPIPQKRLREITIQPAPLAMLRGPSSRTTAGGSATQAIVGGPPPVPTHWIGVIDFDSPHGDSTTWLAGAVAGSSVTAALAPLDDPALNVLGPVADFHVLAKLCEIAATVDGGALPAPATVNMSFGRSVRPNDDPVSPTTCPVPNIACQIAKVIHHVKSDGTYFVAAAGNHGGPLFPGSLDDVISAGMLDATTFVAATATRPAWETPANAEAWIPGSALCLNSWAAPAGSSYSSAMLAGWLVKVLDHPEVLSTLGDGAWMPAWSPTRACYVLARNRKATPWCNPAITTLLAGLRDYGTGGCARTGAGNTVSTSAPGRANTPDPIPSIDTWGLALHPAPESDPCVPCKGNLLAAGNGSDLQVDLSKSEPLPAGIQLDEVSLRVGGSYFELPLTQDDLDLMEAGQLATIVIPGAGALFPPDASISLWYRMKASASIDCASTAGCFWSSTPLMLEPK